MDNSSGLKKKLSENWDQIKNKYPVVSRAEAVADDPIKVDFLQSIDGIKSAEEIGRFFTLSSSESQMIFTDLMNLGAIRFLEDSERLGYLKNHANELERNLTFLRSERERLRGESLYLSKQIREKTDETEKYKTRLPELAETLKELTDNLGSQQSRSAQLWEENSELFGVAKDVKHKTAVIYEGLGKLEHELPRVIKKKSKMAERFKKTDEMRHTGIDKNKEIEKKLFDYHDALNEVHEYLEDTKLRVKSFSDND